MKNLGLLLILACGVSSFAVTKVKEGYIEVEGGKVWYRLVGSGPKTPLICLHGGPGAPHNYLLPLEALAKDRPVLFYDQLGCGKSDNPKDSKYWTIEHYVKEFSQVRKALGIQNCYVYGSSWGSILAVSAYQSDPSGIKGIVMSGTALNIKWWEADAERWLTMMPKKHQRVIRLGNTSGKIDTPEYQAAVQAYYQRHVCRLDPWPKCVDETFAALGVEVYTAMCGPNEFSLTGSLHNLDLTPVLKTVKVPVLYICGEFDEATPETTRRYQRLTPGARMVVLKGCSHLCMVENPRAHNAAVASFLKD